ncbi:hypothetical protein OPQ81_005264 [Rhizoctonia solani]|nr:hypothetical protein OPQ81_005264 [Rhizoctonia solani]
MAVPRSKSGMVSAICSMNTIENGSLIILVEHDLVNSELWIGSCVPGQSGIRRDRKFIESSDTCLSAWTSHPSSYTDKIDVNIPA